MPRKNKTRPLWLNVKYKVPRSVPKWKVLERLKRSIENADGEENDYALPKKWNVILEWRNKESEEMKKDPWQKALQDSAEPSPGFDSAVISYLEGKDVELVRRKKRRNHGRSRLKAKRRAKKVNRGRKKTARSRRK